MMISKRTLIAIDLIAALRRLKALKEFNKWAVDHPDDFKEKPKPKPRPIPDIYNTWEQMSSTTRK